MKPTRIDEIKYDVELNLKSNKFENIEDLIYFIKFLKKVNNNINSCVDQLFEFNQIKNCNLKIVNDQFFEVYSEINLKINKEIYLFLKSNIRKISKKCKNVYLKKFFIKIKLNDIQRI